MNALSELQLEVEAAVTLLTPQAIRAARERAAREQRSVCVVLEDELSLSPELLLQALGRRMQIQALGSSALSTLTPAFDAIGYADAAKRACLAFREHGELIVVVSDPFDEALQAWCVLLMAREQSDPACLRPAAPVARPAYNNHRTSAGRDRARPEEMHR
jgi:hypothetical protein